MQCHICRTSVGSLRVQTLKIKHNGHYARRATLTFGVSADALDGSSVELDKTLAELASGFDLPRSTIAGCPYVTIEMLVKHLWVKYLFKLPKEVVIVNQAGRIVLPKDIFFVDEGWGQGFSYASESSKSLCRLNSIGT